MSWGEFILEVIGVLSLFFSIQCGFINFILVIRGKAIPEWNIFIMSIALTTFIYIQFLLQERMMKPRFDNMCWEERG